MPGQKVVVIGAGVIGASVAFRLAEAGAAVTILDAGRPGGGTSSCTFAWTNARDPDAPPEYSALRAASQRLFPRLAQQIGAPDCYHQHGYVELAADAAALEDELRRLRDRGTRAELIDAARLRELEPELDAGAVRDAAIAWFPDDGWLDPVPYVGALLRAAQAHGAVLRPFARVTQVETSGHRVTGVRLAGGERIDGDVVVNCAGRWSGGLADAPIPDIPLAPRVGLLVYTPPVAEGVRRSVGAPGVRFRPDGAGRILAQVEALEEEIAPDQPVGPAMPQAAEVLRRAGAWLPALRHVAPEAVRTAVRPIPQDGLPAIGPVPRTDGYYLAVTHSGVTLSPIIGQLVASEIVGGADAQDLAPFRPARFVN